MNVVVVPGVLGRWEGERAVMESNHRSNSSSSISMARRDSKVQS